MGFTLWTDGDLAWAAGTYEYRAMGAAVVSATDLFRAADFRATRRPPAALLSFAGNFASLGQINDYLVKARGLDSASSRSSRRQMRARGPQRRARNRGPAELAGRTP